MLRQKNRFHGHGSLRYVYKNGDIIRSRILSTKFTKNKFRKDSRFSVVVSKKVMKHAVGRNRIRRRIYETVRLILPEITESHDIAILVFSSEVITMASEDLTNLIRSQFSDAGIIAGNSKTDNS